MKLDQFNKSNYYEGVNEMANAKRFLTIIAVMAIMLSSSLSADVTVEMKSSLSGIPFITAFEMDQTYGVSERGFFSGSNMKIGVMDTMINAKTMMAYDMESEMMTYCDWMDSACMYVDLEGLDSLLKSDFIDLMLDSLDQMSGMIKDSIDKYLAITGFKMGFSGVEQEVSGYQCQEYEFNVEGEFNMPAGTMPGAVRFNLEGTSWLTDDIKNYSEYRANIDRLYNRFFTPELQNAAERMLAMVGLSPDILTAYQDIYRYINVETEFLINLEIWSPGQDVPSMAFNVSFTSVLVDISFDPITQNVVEVPKDFSVENFNLKELLEKLDDIDEETF